LLAALAVLADVFMIGSSIEWRKRCILRRGLGTRGGASIYVGDSLMLAERGQIKP